MAGLWESPRRIRLRSQEKSIPQKHSIEWVELIAGPQAYRHFLKPGDAPEAVFQIDAQQVSARAYCNLHGL